MIVISYTEDGYQPIPAIRLSDEEYGRALQCFVPVCADVVPIDAKQRLIFLAQRVSKPMTGWWVIGGRMMAHETKEEAAIRNFMRETGCALIQDRLTLVSLSDTRWKDRAQAPQNIGCHTLNYTFSVELTAEEITSISGNLEKNEYEKGTGLSAFTRERLIQENVAPPILDLYDHLFSQARSS